MKKIYEGKIYLKQLLDADLWLDRGLLFPWKFHINSIYPIDSGHKLNVYNTFTAPPEHLLMSYVRSIDALPNFPQ